MNISLTVFFFSSLQTGSDPEETRVMRGIVAAAMAVVVVAVGADMARKLRDFALRRRTAKF